MIASRRSGYAVLPWRTLLTTLALVTAGTHVHAQATHLVKDANRTQIYGLDSTHWVMPVGTGKKVVMPFATLAAGCELWTSDGTPKGTRLLKDIIPGQGGTFPSSPVSFGSGEATRVAFLAHSASDSRDVWVTDGTGAGTVRVFDGSLTHSESQTSMCGSIPGGFFFETRLQNTEDPALYFSDGTEAGTWPLNPVTGETRERFTGSYAYVISGSTCYFLTDSHEVWRSDGTLAGTTKVVTLPEAHAKHWPESLAVAGSRLFIEGRLFADRYVWRCPTVGGDLSDITPPEAAAAQYINFQPAASLGDDVFFSMGGGDEGYTLWASDGFTSGTRSIPITIPGDPAERFIITEIVKWKGTLYFIAGNANNNDRGLWRSDGTAAGTVHLKTFGDVFVEIPDLQPDTAEYLYLQVLSEDYFTADTWQTKGDQASTKPVKNMPSIWEDPGDGPQFAHYQGGMIFSGAPKKALARPYMARGRNGRSTLLVKAEKSTADGIVPHPLPAPSYELLDGYLLQFVDTGKSHELWRMTPDGTKSRSVWKLPAAMNDYEDQASFRGITASGAVFALEPYHGVRQIYVTDGTRKGTRLLSEHQPLDGTRSIDFQQAGDLIFYTVPDVENPQKTTLWKTDGTVAGTSRVLAAGDISPGSVSSQMVPFLGSLWFFAIGSSGNAALWRSDGTTVGTVLVKEDWQGLTGEQAGSLAVVGGKLHLSVGLPGAYAIWESDGTAVGTTLVNPTLTFATIGPAVDLGGVAVFQARLASDTHEQWWRHFGNDTRPVRDGISGRQVEFGDPRFYAVAGTQLFYRGFSPDGDAELWVTDGTSAGTRRVKDIYPGPQSSGPDGFVASGDSVYFLALTAGSASRYWTSDGTEEGTVSLENPPLGRHANHSGGLKEMGGKLYFHYSRPDIGEELHYIDLPLE